MNNAFSIRRSKVFITVFLTAFVIISLTAVAPGAPPEDNETLQIGWASVDLTPDAPVFITGQRYARISEGVMDPITATALALESRFGNGVIMVSCDLISIPDEIRGGDFRGRVRELVAEALPEEKTPKVVLFATHTHAGPEVRDRTGLEERLREGQKEQWADKLDTVMQPREYIDFATERIAGAAVEAWRARQPGGVSFGLSHAVVGHNRIMTYDDGRSRMYGSPDRPNFSHVEGWEDHSVNLLYTWSKNGELTGVLINLASPSQHDENSLRLSADFWHETRVELRRHLGDELHVLPQCSAAGDQSERVMIHRRAERRMERLTGEGRRERIARRITHGVLDILPYMEENIEWNPLFAHAKQKVEMTTREEREDGGGLPIEVYVLRLGDMAFATNPFELYLDFGVRIQERSKAVQTFIVQLAGSGSYLAPERAAKGGAYGSHGAYRNQGNIGPEGGRDWVGKTLGIIEEFWDPVNELRYRLNRDIVSEMRMPQTGWRFQTDPDRQGIDQQWYEPQFDDSDWREDVPIESSWQHHLENDYHGPAWYRRFFEISDLPEWNRVYLFFGAVDEQAQVWVNGIFVGECTDGWDVPFYFDITEELDPEAENHVAVRAKNTRMAGGIWRPVRLFFFR